MEKQQVGTAYGLVTAIQNSGMAAFPLLVAQVYNIGQAYVPNVELFFASLACLGVVIGVFLNIYDAKTGHVSSNLLLFLQHSYLTVWFGS